MKPIIHIFLFLATVVLLSGCNTKDTSLENSRQILSQLGDATIQKSYRFDGSSTLRGDNFIQQNIVNFTGMVGNDGQTYLRLLTAQEDSAIMEDMDLYVHQDQIYMRYADQVDWEPVQEQKELVESELSHLSPQAHFDRMLRLAKKVEHSGKKANISMIRVILDEDQLKNEFLQNVRSRVHGDRSTKMQKITKMLSTGQAGEEGILEEIEGLYNTLQEEFAELEQNVRIRGEYTIHYDTNEKVPTKLVYIQTTDYTEDGRNESEISELEISFTQYGSPRVKIDLPPPMSK